MDRIETKADMRMIGRAIREGWNYDREKVVRMLMDVVESDPEMALDAIDRLQKGEEIDLKRQEVELKRELVELKKLGDENHVRLRLLELARLVKPDELARLASEHGLTGSAVNGQKG